MIIYVITNKINGKKYVGQTVTSLNHRFQRGHLSEVRTGRRKTPLYNGIRKYGEDNFEVGILEECSSQEELNQREKFWIKKLNTLTPQGYNVLIGGDSKQHSQETKNKISEIRKRQITEGLTPGFTGKKHSPETRRLLSEKSKGNNNAKGAVRSKEWKEKQRAAHLGKKLTEETKQKIGAAVRGDKNPNFGKRGPETSRYGVVVSEETRRKLREVWVKRKEQLTC